MNKNRPIAEIRSGGNVKLAIFKNDTEYGARYTSKPVRFYRTDNGWATSDSFNEEDLAHLALAAQKASAYIDQLRECSEEQLDAAAE